MYYLICGKKLDIDVKIEKQLDFFIKSFHDSSYYFMFPFSSVEKKLNFGLLLIKQNKRPFNDKLFDIIDDILDL